MLPEISTGNLLAGSLVYNFYERISVKLKQSSTPPYLILHSNPFPLQS